MHKDYVKMGVLSPVTFAEYVRDWAEKYGDRTAAADEETEITYSELHHKSSRLASGLKKLGIGKGDRIAVQLPNCISFLLVCFAAHKIGAIPLMILPAMREQEIVGIFKKGTPKAYVIPESFLGFEYGAMAENAKKQCDFLEYVITCGNNGALTLDSLYDDNEAEVYGGFAEQPAFLLLSGGTTNTIPKLIPRTHMDYAYTAVAGGKKCGFNKDTVYLAALPAEHNFTLGNPGILGTLFVGGKVVFAPTTSADETFPLIEDEGVTDTSVVPSVLKLWIKEAEYDEYDISSLKVIMVGGSKLERSLAEQVKPKLGCCLRQVYGTAEGLNTCTSLDDPIDVIVNTQGTHFSEYDEIRIADENGNELPCGTAGELLLKGPYTIHGYYNAPEQNKTSFTEDGFYKSGDMAMLTEKGDLVIIGRMVEQINKGGEKIRPAEVEEILLSYDKIKDAAVIGVKDDDLGEKIAAFVVTDGCDINEEEVRKYFFEKKVTGYKIPDKLVMIDKIPLTKMGKPDKKELKKMLEQ